MRKSLDLKLPFVGNTARVETRDLLVLSLQSDQIFVLFPQTGHRPDLEIAEIAGDQGSVTDQSDGWALLRVSGPGSRTALERICMLDLHPDIFTVGAVARTVMEHLGMIIHRNDEHSFLLMSARSSAEFFAHAVVTSAENVS
nr:sarcosine oxidase subunit gamma family protein [Flavimaribacter sediminis]